MTEKTYRALTGSLTGHCCFVAAVVRKATDSDHDLDVDNGEVIVCECVNLSDAEMIADALNAAAARGEEQTP
jgi:hypothetical protein